VLTSPISFWPTTLRKPFRSRHFLSPFFLKHTPPSVVSKPWIICRRIHAPTIPTIDLSVHSQTGRAHLLLISRTPGSVGGAIGILTLEGTVLKISSLSCLCNDVLSIAVPDVIEVSISVLYYDNPHSSCPQEIISEEIVDETDLYEDNHHKVQPLRSTTASILHG